MAIEVALSIVVLADIDSVADILMCEEDVVILESPAWDKMRVVLDGLVREGERAESTPPCKRVYLTKTSCGLSESMRPDGQGLSRDWWFNRPPPGYEYLDVVVAP